MAAQMMVGYRALLIIACIVLQILDGTFTAYGVLFSSLGLDIEANPLVKSAMSVFGIMPGLVLVKGLCVVVLVSLRNIAPNHFYGIIFGIYLLVVSDWAKAIFVDNLIR